MVFSVLSWIRLLNRWKSTLTELLYEPTAPENQAPFTAHLSTSMEKSKEGTRGKKLSAKTKIGNQHSWKVKNNHPIWTLPHNDTKEFGIIHVHCPKTTGFLCAQHCYMTCAKHSFKTEYMDKFALDKQNSLVHIIDNIKKIISHCLDMQEKKRILSLFNNVNLYHIMKQNL